MSFVSVVVPVFNGERHLAECLESIRAQRYDGFEVVVVDDGSTDSSADIIREYVRKDQRFRLVSQPNRGLVNAWKRGVRESCGALITFVDADDVVASTIIADMVEVLIRDASDVVVVRVGRFSEDVSEMVPEMVGLAPRRYDVSVFASSLILNARTGAPVVPHSRWGKLFRRQSIVRLMDAIPDDVSLGEDELLTVPLMLGADGISVVGGRPLYFYRKHAESMTRMTGSDYWDKRAPASVVLEGLVGDAGIPGFLHQLSAERLELCAVAMRKTARAGKRNIPRTVREVRRLSGEPLVRQALADVDRGAYGWGPSAGLALARVLPTVGLLVFAVATRRPARERRRVVPGVRW